MGVTTVDDDVTLLEVWLELTNEIINGLTGFDEEDDFSGFGQFGAELFDRVGANDVGSC